MNSKTLLALTIGALLSPAALAQSISGVVVDKTGKPISKAKIVVSGTQKYTVADANGHFTINGVTPGKTQLHVTANSYKHLNKEYEVPSAGISGINIVMTSTVFDVIEVNATPLHSSTIESALPVNVVSGDELRLKQASTLGETLKNEVGVHSTYYGPVASSPVIRGLDGPRVMVTQNGLDAGDASRVGPDHAIAAEASTATQIEVLRGPATLFYGSGAIGGVVNVVDNRVPHDKEPTGDWLIEHNTVSSENLGSFSFNGANDNWAVHADGYWRESDDFKLAGPAELESDFDEHHDEDEEHNDSDRLENSSSESSGFTVGASYILDNGFVGFSAGRIDRVYDVPGHTHGGEEHEDHEDEEVEDDHAEHEEESVYADMQQQRFQVISKLLFDDGYFSELQGKFAYTDYNHQEIEGGAVGTTFDNQSLEGRIDLYHNEHNGFTGAWSFHYKHSDFEALGEEAFTPPSKTETLAVSMLEEKHFDNNIVLQVGGRIEHVTLKANAIELELGEHEEHEEDEHDEHEDHDEHELTNVDFGELDFSPISVSAGLIYNFTEGYNVALSTSYAQRAPSASEIFSFGPHIGTQSFEVGALFDVHAESDEEEFHVDLRNGDDIEMETSLNLDLTLRKFEGDLGFVFNVFYNKVDDFFYQRNTDLFMDSGHEHGEEDDEHDDHDDELDDDHAAEEDGLPVLVFAQQDAKLYGFEAQVMYQVNNNFKISAFSDAIRGKLNSGENLPRIPPMRFGTTFNYDADNYSAELSLTRYSRQDDTGYLETSTDGYTMVDMNFNYYLGGDLTGMTLYLKGHNLTDENARVHSSFLKNTVPLPGRGFSLGMRGSF